jgi:hypothetical protein
MEPELMREVAVERRGAKELRLSSSSEYLQLALLEPRRKPRYIRVEGERMYIGDGERERVRVVTPGEAYALRVAMFGVRTIGEFEELLSRL